ncbi:hypothetical protein GCM10023189_05040 [Nibrella saemangeumensis]|uniref:LysM domain-containing protein n=1 Tax=Nibrella saemangeumensis TaxID=1084526 RepID=A0ABP8MD43_9BACT
MKKLHFPITFLFVLIWMHSPAQPQPGFRADVPVVPTRIMFAGLSVQMDEGARAIIQQDVNALMANRQYWDMKLNRSALYFPIIEGIFAEEQVPLDFKYLAVQESSLTPDAVSTSMAVGYWQFKRETALDHGLRVDDEVDERKSITASTRGAARYLKRTNTIFNNWVSALYSYYLGAGGISRLIPQEWANAREISVDASTDRYILRCFAHKLAIENALQTFKPSNAVSLVEYPRGNGKQFSQIAQELGIDEFELRKYNRWISGDAVPADKPYVMAIPVPNERLADFRRRLNLPADKPVLASNINKPIPDGDDIGFPVLRRTTPPGRSKNEPIYYEINGLKGIQAQAGDKPSSLANKAGVSLSSFLRYNDMGERDPVITGEVYYLQKKRRKGMVPYHTVREDETMRTISQMYAVRLKKLLRYNRLDRIQKLQVGRVMWLQKRRPNGPVEILNAPAPGTPAPAPDRSTVARNEPSTRPTENTNAIPRTAAERKLYQPKLVTPTENTAEPQRPEPVASRPANQPASRPATTTPVPTTSQPLETPTNTPAQAVSAPAPSSGSTNQRVIIVRPAEEDLATNTRPTTTPAPTPAKPVSEPAPKAIYPGTEPKTTSTYSRPASTPANIPAESRPAPTRPVTPAATVPSGAAATHSVLPGQTYYSISRLYGLTVDQLLALNSLTVNDKLSVGQELVVRSAGSTTNRVPSTRTAVPSSAPATPQYHTVMKGETMYRISKQYGVSIEQIQEWNQLSDVTVREGQRIRIIKQL